METSSDEIWEQLISKKKLDRDRGIIDLKKLLERSDPDDFNQLTAFIAGHAGKASEYNNLLLSAQEDAPSPPVTTSLETAAAAWEYNHGLLSAFKVLIAHPWKTDEFCGIAQKFSVAMLTHHEYRVRLAAGETLGVLCSCYGTSTYLDTKALILSGIRDNLERGISRESSICEDSFDQQPLGSGSPRTSALLSGENAVKSIFHDTAGWKNLETFMKGLQSVIDGCGSRFNSHIDQELLDLIFAALTHTNRFVRETGYEVCSALVSCNSQVEDLEMHPDASIDSIRIFGMQFAEHLATGLADNWSQVRLAASQATRQFLLALDENSRQEYMSLLLPRMCLNRYYVAEGVRLYSQDTWRRVTGEAGKTLVERYIQPTVDYYISQSQADNHAVREAACACIAELGSKIDRDCVRPHVAPLLDALKICFEDDSWPVRDAACVASGNFVHCFPEEAKDYLPKLIPLFYENLQDNIPSVRLGAAQALADVAKTYGDQLAHEMLEVVETSLKDVEKQQANTEKYSALDKSPATYSVVKRARDNDADLHSNNTMYSCGSLAPKMGRGGKDKGGCMNATFRRPAEPWEKAEGCVHLMAELSSLTACHQRVSTLLPLLGAAASHRNYTHHMVLLETLCKRLPLISKNIGKRLFKPHIELFLEPIFYSLSCDNALTASAASQCLNLLSQWLGPNILRGRVEMHNPEYLPALETNLTIAPM